MTANQIQLYYKTSTDPISKHRNLSLGAHTGPPEVSGEGLTVPERVGPRGADNAASLVLACLPCAQAVNPYGRHPLTKKRWQHEDLWEKNSAYNFWVDQPYDRHRVEVPELGI